jgi:hypothetical protein
MIAQRAGAVKADGRGRRAKMAPIPSVPRAALSQANPERRADVTRKDVIPMSIDFMLLPDDEPEDDDLEDDDLDDDEFDEDDEDGEDDEDEEEEEGYQLA